MKNKDLQSKKEAKKPANSQKDVKAATKNAAKKEEKKEVFTRVDSVCEVLKKHVPESNDALIKEADAVYVKKTGKPANYSESKFAVVRVVPALRHFGIAVPEK